MRRIVLPVLSMVAASFTSFEAHASTAQEIEARIKRIESGLSPPVLVKGDSEPLLPTLAERMQPTHTARQHRGLQRRQDRMGSR